MFSNLPQSIHLYLLQYFTKQTSSSPADRSLLDRLMVPLWEMSQTFKASTAKLLQQFVSQRQSEYTEVTERKGRGGFPRFDTVCTQ